LNKQVHSSLTINKAFIILLKTLKMNISIGNDHAGPVYKKEIVTHLESKGHIVYNHGTDTEDSVDYPDFIHPVAEDVSSKKSALGIIICGSGNGASMTANKHQDIRAALCWNAEIVSLARQHNDANILSIPARFVSIQEALEMVDVFITTAFEGGRHKKRVDKIACS
jgi:ribose 5-phosphate isomerase B